MFLLRRKRWYAKKSPIKKFIGPALDEKLTSAVLNNKRLITEL
jgi:hypothetical protein